MRGQPHALELCGNLGESVTPVFQVDDSNSYDVVEVLRATPDLWLWGPKVSGGPSIGEASYSQRFRESSCFFLDWVDDCFFEHP
jgi:hypothetical protein